MLKFQLQFSTLWFTSIACSCGLEFDSLFNILLEYRHSELSVSLTVRKSIKWSCDTHGKEREWASWVAVGCFQHGYQWWTWWFGQKTGLVRMEIVCVYFCGTGKGWLGGLLAFEDLEWVLIDENLERKSTTEGIID